MQQEQKLQNRNMDAELNVHVITFWSPVATDGQKICLSTARASLLE